MLCELDTGYGHIGVNIRIDYQKRIIPKQMQSIVNSTAGFQDCLALIAVRDMQAILRTRTDTLFNLFSMPPKVYHHILDCRVTETIKMPFEQTPSADLDKSLRNIIGQWS